MNFYSQVSYQYTSVFQYPYSRPTINLTETRDLVRSSSTPAFSRYFLNSSFFASCVIFDMVADEGLILWKEYVFVRRNVDGRNAACFLRSALALHFSLNHDLSFLRGVSSLLDNITTTPMSLATRQKTTPAKKSLTPLSDIRAAWTPHLDKKKYVWTIQFTFPVGRSSGAFQSDPEKDNLVVGPGFHLVVNIFSDRTTCPRSMRLQQ